MRQVWPGVYCVHGRQGHGKAEAERVQNASAGRPSACSHLRHCNPQGCNLRGYQGLGYQRGDHTLHSGLSCRAPPLPHDGGYPALSYTAFYGQLLRSAPPHVMACTLHCHMLHSRSSRAANLSLVVSTPHHHTQHFRFSYWTLRLPHDTESSGLS